MVALFAAAAIVIILAIVFGHVKKKQKSGNYLMPHENIKIHFPDKESDGKKYDSTYYYIAWC